MNQDVNETVAKCPSEIADVVAELIYQGVIRARGLAHPGYDKRCFLELDHIHNLPHIINDFRVERLQFYWDKERPAFMRRVPANEIQDLTPLWDQLGQLMKAHGMLQVENTMAMSHAD